MATYISDTRIAHLQTSPQAYEYVTLTGTCTRSGNTVTLSNLVVQVRVSYAYSAYGENQNYYIASSQYGSALTQTGTFVFNYSDGPNHTESHSMPNMSFSVGVSDTSKTLYLRAAANEDAQIPFTVTFPSGVVAPTTPTVSTSDVTMNSITVTYGTTSYGNPSTGTVTLYGGTSPNPTTVLATSSTTGNNTFTHTGLTPGTTYYYRAKATNGQADSSYSTEVSATTKNVSLYGSVNGQSKKIVKLYGSANGVNGVTGEIRAGGRGNVTAFDGEVFWSKQRTNLDSTAIDCIEVRFLISQYYVNVFYTDGTNSQQIYQTHSAADLKTDCGVTANDQGNFGHDYIDITLLYGNVTKEITKLYGSVNGQTKQIFLA